MKNKALFLAYRIRSGKIEYLLCDRVNGGKNSITTGTCETGEIEEMCAFREIREELGIKHFRNFFSLNLKQNFKTDRNHYAEKAFAFEVCEPIKLQKKELSSYSFLSKKEALELTEYDFHKKAIKVCDTIIKNESYNKIFTIVGAGGSGKDTLIHKAVAKDKKLLKIKTYMTRKYKAKGDASLRIYVTEKKLEKLEGGGDIIEKNKMVNYWYASSYSQMIGALSKGKDGIINLDINGAEFYQNNFSNVITIFINANTEDLLRRLKQRQRDSSEYIAKRMEVTKEEIAKSHICDYTIVNKEGKLNESVGELLAIIKENRK